MKKYQNIKHMRKVLKYFGSVSNLSRHLKISRAAIYKWKSIPRDRAYEIQIKSDGKITARSLLRD